MPQVQRRSIYSGIAMAEYVLIGSTVLVVCLIALMGAGKNLQDWLLGLKGDMAQHVQQAQQVQLAQTDVAQVQDTSEEDNANGPIDLGSVHVSPSNPNKLCGQDFCVNAPGLTGTSVATAGSNGNTNITDTVARIYSQLAQVMAAKGIDPNSVDLLTQLAIKGHTIADQQNLLHDQRALIRAWNTSNHTSPEPDNYKIMQNAANKMRARLAEFRDLSAQLNASIDNYPEDTRGLLTGAAQVIQKVGSAYYYGTSSTSSGLKRLNFTVELQNIQIVHTNSNTICDNGGDQAKCHRGQT